MTEVALHAFLANNVLTLRYAMASYCVHQERSKDACAETASRESLCAA